MKFVFLITVMKNFDIGKWMLLKRLVKARQINKNSRKPKFSLISESSDCTLKLNTFFWMSPNSISRSAFYSASPVWVPIDLKYIESVKSISLKMKQTEPKNNLINVKLEYLKNYWVMEVAPNNPFRCCVSEWHKLRKNMIRCTRVYHKLRNCQKCICLSFPYLSLVRKHKRQNESFFIGFHSIFQWQIENYQFNLTLSGVFKFQFIYFHSFINLFNY